MEPLCETAHRALIETHLAEDNWSEAYRQFQQHRRLLRDELDVEPSDAAPPREQAATCKALRIPGKLYPAAPGGGLDATAWFR
jgi:DNA-binding SARP family transcriptional activator